MIDCSKGDEEGEREIARVVKSFIAMLEWPEVCEEGIDRISMTDVCLGQFVIEIIFDGLSSAVTVRRICLLLEFP